MKELRYWNLLQDTEKQPDKRLDTDCYVTGYATTFDRYLMWQYDKNKAYEQIDREAFTGIDMSDVIMNYNHTGKTLARTKNKTLGLEVTDRGLFIYADLSKSHEARILYDEIKAGLIDQMSWAFTVEKDEIIKQDEHTVLRRILKVKKIYDVSAVSIPANPNTDLFARSFECNSGKNTDLDLAIDILKLNILLEELK